MKAGSDYLLTHLARVQEENRRLKQRIYRLERSRDSWRERALASPCVVLRRRVRELERSRDFWRHRALTQQRIVRVPFMVSKLEEAA